MFSKREITKGGMNSEQFKEIRLQLRLTQAELAGLLWVHADTIKRWERLPRVGKGVPETVRFAMYFLVENYPAEYRNKESKESKARIKKEEGYNQHEKKPGPQPQPGPIQFPEKDEPAET